MFRSVFRPVLRSASLCTAGAGPAARPTGIRALPKVPAINSAVSSRVFSQSSFWQLRKFTQEHEWVDLPDDSNIATIGITQYATGALGDIVYAELPELEADVYAGETIGTVESVKSASDVMAPVSGQVVKTNQALVEKPKTVNDDPEKDGWFARIEIKNQNELEALMDEEQYKTFTEKVAGEEDH